MDFNTAYQEANNLIRYDYRYNINPEALKGLRNKIISKLLNPCSKKITAFANGQA